MANNHTHTHTHKTSLPQCWSVMNGCHGTVKQLLGYFCEPTLKNVTRWPLISSTVWRFCPPVNTHGNHETRWWDVTVIKWCWMCYHSDRETFVSLRADLEIEDSFFCHTQETDRKTHYPQDTSRGLYHTLHLSKNTWDTLAAPREPTVTLALNLGLKRSITDACHILRLRSWPHAWCHDPQMEKNQIQTIEAQAFVVLETITNLC